MSRNPCKRWTRFCVLAFCFFAASLVSLHASGGKAPTVRTSVAGAKKNPTSSARGERVDMSKAKVKKGWDYPYLLAAYLLTWVLFLLYVLFLRKRLHASELELRRLERLVEDVLEVEDSKES